MQRFYSPSTGCSYLSSIHGKNMPKDVFEISEDVYVAVIGNPAPGMIRAHDKQGMPYLTDPPVVIPDPEVEERKWRDAELSSVMWLRERHRDQQEIGSDTTLSRDQFSGLLVYMQQLRDWPQSPEFPAAEHRPVGPNWLSQ